MISAPNSVQPYDDTGQPPFVARSATGTAAITITVPGSAAPQGSKRHVGNGRMIESSKAVGPWRERVALAAHNAMAGRPLLEGAISIRIEFVLTRPKSTPKSYTPNAIKRPDVDKLARAILDAITGTVLWDDSQMTELHATKRIAEIGEAPHASISCSKVEPARGVR